MMCGSCLLWHSVSVTAASSGVLFPPVGVHSLLGVTFCSYLSDAPFCWRVTGVVYSIAMMELEHDCCISVRAHSRCLASALNGAAKATAIGDGVSAVPPRVRIHPSPEHTLLSSGCWESGSGVLLSSCKWRVAVSRIRIISDCNALTKEETLRPSSGTNMADMRTGTRWAAWSMMYSQMEPAAVANTFLIPLVTMVFGSFSVL